MDITEKEGGRKRETKSYISIFNIHNDPSYVTLIVHPRVHCARAWVSGEAHGGAASRSLPGVHEICFSSRGVATRISVVVHRVVSFLCTRSVHFPGLPTERTLPLLLMALPSRRENSRKDKKKKRARASLIFFLFFFYFFFL